MSARWKGPSRDHEAATGTEAGAMRFSTQTTAAPNTRVKAGENERLGASRQKAGGFAGTDSGDPRPRGGPLHRSAAKKRPFLLDRSAAHFLFNKIEKKMGGGMPQPASWLNPPGGRLPPLHLSEGGPPAGAGLERPQSSHSPLWASHHAGNAGSFGERVGLIGWAKRVVSFFLALNGWIKSTPLQFPK